MSKYVEQTHSIDDRARCTSHNNRCRQQVTCHPPRTSGGTDCAPRQRLRRVASGSNLRSVILSRQRADIVLDGFHREQANIPQLHEARKHPPADRPSRMPFVDYNTCFHACLSGRTCVAAIGSVPNILISARMHALILRRVFCSASIAASMLAWRQCVCAVRHMRRSRTRRNGLRRLLIASARPFVGMPRADERRRPHCATRARAVSHYHYPLSRNSLSIA